MNNCILGRFKNGDAPVARVNLGIPRSCFLQLHVIPMIFPATLHLVVAAHFDVHDALMIGVFPALGIQET